VYSIIVSHTVIISAFLTSTYKPVCYVAFTNEDKYIILLILIIVVFSYCKSIHKFTHKFYFQLLHKASFYPPTCARTTAAWNIYDIK